MDLILLILNKVIMKTLNYLAFIIISGMMIISCSKDSASNNSRSLTIRMTDAPAPYSAVNVDVQGVEATSNDGSTVMMPTNNGVYNLLDLSNGKEAILASSQMDMEHLRQIRLILGPNNSMVLDNVTYPLPQPSAQDPGLIVTFDKALEPGGNTILFDFDANRSITSNAPNNYTFQPVLRAVDASTMGSIIGKMDRTDVRAAVRAIREGAIYYSSISPTGEFAIKGLPPGSYSITLIPGAPYSPVTVSDLNVQAGGTVDVGVMHL